MIAPRPLSGVLMIVAAGIGLGIGYNAARPRPLPWIAEPLKPAVSLDSLESKSDTAAASDMMVDTSKRASIPMPPVRAETTVAAARSDVESPAGGETTAVAGLPSSGRNAFPEIPESEDPIKINLSQAKRFFDRGGMVILDARDPEDYAEGHIQGAASAPTEVMRGDIEWLEKTAKDPRPIMVYCSGGDCELSIDLATELTRTGHRRMLVFEEGFPAWQTAGYPVQVGTTP